MSDLRARVSDALKRAMKDKDAARLSTLRLINAAIKDRDIAARGEGREDGVNDSEVLAILGKMTKQRMESARAYEEGGRLDLAERERAEIAVIEEFLPRQLSDAEVEKAVDAAIAEVGEEKYRMWIAYLAGVSIAFADGSLRIFQTVASKHKARGPSGMPPTRADLYRD